MPDSQDKQPPTQPLPATLKRIEPPRLDSSILEDPALSFEEIQQAFATAQQ